MSEYHVLQRLATGGMSELFVVRRPEFPKRFAMKLLLPTYSDRPSFREMLVAEGELGARLKHPNLVEVIDIGEANGRPYIVMDLVEGIDLRRFIDEAPQNLHAQIPIEIAVFIACKVARGLDYAHERLTEEGAPLNVVHRDVSPGNVLLSYTGHVKVADFGIAKGEHFRDLATDDGILKGKLRYMAPEYANNESFDHLADVFSIGLLLFEMVTGRSAYGDVITIESMVTAIKTGAIPDVLNFRMDCPPEVREIISKATAKNPKDRYQKAGELAEALDDYLFTLPKRVGERTLAGVLSHWEDGDDDTTLDEFVLPTRPISKEFIVPRLATTEPPEPDENAEPLPKPERHPDLENPQIVTSSGFQRYTKASESQELAAHEPSEGEEEAFLGTGSVDDLDVAHISGDDLDIDSVNFDDDPIGDEPTYQMTMDEHAEDQTHQVDIDAIDIDPIGDAPTEHVQQIPGRAFQPTEKTDIPEETTDPDPSPVLGSSIHPLGNPGTIPVHFLEPLDPNADFSEEPTGNTLLSDINDMPAPEVPDWSVPANHRPIQPAQFVPLNDGLPNPDSVQRRALTKANTAILKIAETSEALGITTAVKQAKSLASENLERVPEDQKKSLMGIVGIFGGLIALVYFLAFVITGC